MSQLHDEYVFRLLMERFDAIEKQNDAQIFLMTKHIEDAAKVHKVVDKHVTYWTLVLYVTGVLVATGASLAAAFIR